MSVKGLSGALRPGPSGYLLLIIFLVFEGAELLTPFGHYLAEKLHVEVRKQHWAYNPEENLDNEALIREEYRGIRPAPGYPACPDHTEKTTLFELLEVQKNIGVELTESLAMYPAASVCGWYFANPEAKYFGVGKVQKDQIEDMADKKEMNVSDYERWMGPNLSYTPKKEKVNV